MLLFLDFQDAFLDLRALLQQAEEEEEMLATENT